jgi:hypothetical protein
MTTLPVGALTQPILIGGVPVFMRFWAIPRNAGDPARIEATFTKVGSEADLTLDALVGPQGNPGEAAPIIRPQWGSPVTEVADLPNVATLDDSDDGRAWYIDGQWYVYADQVNDYHVIQGSIPGPVGATPNVSMSAEIVEPDGPVYGPIDVVETGTSLAPNFHFPIPGIPGPEGPASAIRLASDYDDTDPPDSGDGLIWDDAIEKWKPGRPTLYVPKKYTIPHTSFINYTGSAPRQLIASKNIAAQDSDWYPEVIGHLTLSQSAILSSVNYEVEVRCGITGGSTGESEPLCGLGPYDPTWALLDAASVVTIIPHFSSTAFPGRSLAPDSDEGRCLAGDAMTIYVFLHRVGGSGTIVFNQAGAQLRINVDPAGE